MGLCSLKGDNMKEDIKDYVERYPTYLESLDQIDQLKQQLAETEQKFLEFQEDSIRNEQTYVRELTEKQNTIDEINKEFVQAIHDWKTLCAEKDKEIERLKNFFELNNEVVINQGKEMFDLRVQVLQQKQNQTQLAIQELEKVKNYFIEECEDGDGIKTEDRVIKKDIYEVADFIENQIKELKGNNDEPNESN